MDRDAARAREALAALFARMDRRGDGVLGVAELSTVFGDYAQGASPTNHALLACWVWFNQPCNEVGGLGVGFLSFCDLNDDEGITSEEWLTVRCISPLNMQ